MAKNKYWAIPIYENPLAFFRGVKLQRPRFGVCFQREYPTIEEIRKRVLDLYPTADGAWVVINTARELYLKSGSIRRKKLEGGEAVFLGLDKIFLPLNVDEYTPLLKTIFIDHLSMSQRILDEKALEIVYFSGVESFLTSNDFKTRVRAKKSIALATKRFANED